MRYDVILVLDNLDDPVVALAQAREGLVREGVVLVVDTEGGERRLRQTAAAAGFTRVRRVEGIAMELRR